MFTPTRIRETLGTVRALQDSYYHGRVLHRSAARQMTMDATWLLNILTWVAFFGVGIVPLIISLRVKVRTLRILSLLLGSFAIIHGLYHLSLAYSMYFFSEVILDPLSVAFLVAFGIYYSKKAVI